MLRVIVSFAVWLIKEIIKMIIGYIERVNEKAVVPNYENFTKINPSS